MHAPVSQGCIPEFTFSARFHTPSQQGRCLPVIQELVPKMFGETDTTESGITVFTEQGKGMGRMSYEGFQAVLVVTKVRQASGQLLLLVRDDRFY
jgi:hypothetical protein